MTNDTPKDDGPNDGLRDEDEVTVPAGSDLISQLRDEAQQLRHTRADEDARDLAVVDDGDVTVWRSGEQNTAASANDVADDFADDATAVMQRPSVDDFADDVTAVMQPRASSSGPDPDEQRATQTRDNVPTDNASLIGESAPPPTSTTYWQSSDQSPTLPGRPQAPTKRRRVPVWLVALVAVLLIIGASVAIAVLVAGTSSG